MPSQFPGADVIIWLSPLGRSARLMIEAFSWQSIKNLSWKEIQAHCRWMGLKSFSLVALSAVFVAIALLIQCVLELQKYRAHHLAGAIIAVGLLREIGPLTVGFAWCARIAACVSEEARTYIMHNSERDFAHKFILPRYIAALAMSIPLSTYGLVIGFVTAALVAPLLGVSSTNDFLESAQQAVEDKDLLTYFLKLILICPAVSIFAGSACALGKKISSAEMAANAVTATFISAFVANLIVTFVMYYR